MTRGARTEAQAVALSPNPHGTKYRAVRVVDPEDGSFDSQGEHRRWMTLKLLVGAGEISDLRRQVAYKLVVNGKLVATYVADYVYLNRDGQEVVEDWKGVRTATYRLKAKLMEALHGIRILETGSRRPKATAKKEPPKRRSARIAGTQ